MKLLIATGIYPPIPGGPATYAKLLFEELPEKGIKTKVFSFDEVRKYPKGVSHLFYLVKLLVLARDVDLICAQDPVSVGYPTMIVSKLLRKKYVLRLGGDFAWEQGVKRFGVKDTLDEFVKGDKEYDSNVMRLKRVQKKVAENSEKIIVPSVYLKNIVVSWGIDDRKVRVIYNSFEGTVLKETKEDLRKEYGYDGPIIFTAARLVPWKGIGTLISIMPNLMKKFPDIRLVVVGSGPEKEELDKLIKEGNLEDKVEMMGALPQIELFKRLKASDVFVLNTAYEGLSHQILEALSIGTPIVTTNVGGNPEVIVDKKNGLLVEYDNKKELENSIELLIKDRNLADEFVKEGQETVKGFSKEKLLTEITKEFKSIIQIRKI